MVDFARRQFLRYSLNRHNRAGQSLPTQPDAMRKRDGCDSFFQGTDAVIIRKMKFGLIVLPLPAALVSAPPQSSANRPAHGEIPRARLTEEDVLARNLVNPKSKLNMLIRWSLKPRAELGGKNP